MIEMNSYKNASEVGQDLILSYFKKRMKEKKITQNKLAEILGIGVTTLYRYFKKETPMPLGVYLEICGALDLRPYLMPSESDNTEMQRMFFN
jgi:transcriptional regulator with XRE-family HTH domain